MSTDFDFRNEQLSPSDKEYEQKLRPLIFDDFNGQAKIVENLKTNESNIQNYTGRL